MGEKTSAAPSSHLPWEEEETPTQQAASRRPGVNKWERKLGRVVLCRLERLASASSPMFVRGFLLVLWALSAEADFFQLDSISNVSTYYFNYIYCNIWEGECQPNQDDATQQGKRRLDAFIELLQAIM